MSMVDKYESLQDKLGFDIVAYIMQSYGDHYRKLRINPDTIKLVNRCENCNYNNRINKIFCSNYELFICREGHYCSEFERKE